MSAPPGLNNGGSVDEAALLDAAADHSLLLLLRGIAAIAFAVLAFFWPKLTIIDLTILWAAYSFVDGVLALTAAIRLKAGRSRAWLGLIGMGGIVCAGAVLIAPLELAAHLAAIVSTWACLTGAMYVWVALKLRKAVRGGWILALDGIGIVLFGLALAFWPRLELAALVWLTGWFAALLGSLLLYIRLWLGRSRRAGAG
jgi:uncharacterized membrane protein HdeD (DUF308 family)